MKLIPTNEALNIVSFGLAAVQQTTNGVRKAFDARVKQQNKEIAANRLNAARLLDAEKKAEKEKIIEAKKPAGTLGAGSVQTAMSAGGGFMQRLIKALGYIVAGFVLTKLPQIIEEVKRFTAMVNRIIKEITGTFDQLTETIGEIRDVAEQLWDNVQNMDFLDSEGKLRKELNEATSSIDRSRNQMTLSFENIKQAINDYVNGKGGAPEPTPTPTPGPDGKPSPSPTPTPTPGGKMKKEHREALDAISKYESAGSGGYNAMNQGTIPDKKGQKPKSGHSYDIIGKNLTSMTIKEVLDHQKLSRNNDQGFIHAAGRYQFIGNTLPGLVERSGLPLNTKFNEETQDLLAVQLIQERGAEPWLADPRNRLQYDKEALAKIEKARQTPLEKPAPSPSPKPTPPPAKPQPQTPKAGSVVDTGYKDYKGRPIKLEPAAAAAFKEMANAAMSSGLSKAVFEQGISSSYRDDKENERVEGAEKSRHKVGLAIDINWNLPGGVWIRENAHKYGFHHLNYSEKSTHFDFTGKRTKQRPYSTTLAAAPTSKMNIDPNSLEGPEESPLVVPMPINSIAKEPSGGGGGGATQRTPDIQPASSDLIALAHSLNQAFT